VGEEDGPLGLLDKVAVVSHGDPWLRPVFATVGETSIIDQRETVE
jgi:hypothetical protein